MALALTSTQLVNLFAQKIELSHYFQMRESLDDNGLDQDKMGYKVKKSQSIGWAVVGHL